MSIEDLMELSSEMIAEMNRERIRCKELVDSEPKSVGIRRIAIRSLFSSIDGMCYLMKFWAFMKGGRIGGVGFNREELAMINEETYYLDEKGEARIRDFFPSMKGNLRFTFKILAKVYQSDFELDVGGTGFKEFQEAIDIRNRVTHPKGMKDLDVSQDDFEKVTRAHDWFVSNMRKLSKRLMEADKRQSG